MHDPFTDSNINSLNKELSCPICLGIISKSTVVEECLHRFCYDCINTALRIGNKECPSCRAPCPNKRNLRIDLRFDNIISKFYPKNNQFTPTVDVEDVKLSNKKLPKRILARSGKIEKAIHGNINDHKRNIKLLKSASVEYTHSVSSSSGEEKITKRPTGFIEFNPKIRWNVEIELIPYPNEQDNPNTISVRTLRECTAQHLADCLKIHLGTDKEIALFTTYDRKGFVIFVDVDLDKEISELAFIDFLPLYYKIV